MGRIIALDWGSRRVGFALSDPSQTIAQTLEPSLHNDTKIFQNLKKLFHKYEPEKVIVGFPKSLKGNVTQSTQEVREFIDSLRERTGVSVELVDERLSTVGALERFNSFGSRKSQKKDWVDNMAAQILLENYLKSHPAFKE